MSEAGDVAPRRVLLVDDHPIVRQGLRRMIANERDLEVCGEAETVREARQAVRDLAPDVVVVDLSLREGDGIDLVRELRAHHPDLPVLVLSMHDETVFAGRLLAAGARGYMMKQAASEQFISAVRCVLTGGAYTSEASAAPTRTGKQPRGPGPVGRLSNRELQILQMLGRGLSSRQVADALHLSIKTVEVHRQRIKGKLDLKTSAQLVQFAANWVAGAGRAPDPAA